MFPSSVLLMDPHYFGNPDPDPHKSKNLIRIRKIQELQTLKTGPWRAIRGFHCSVWRRWSSKWSCGRSLKQWSETCITLTSSRVRIRIKLKSMILIQINWKEGSGSKSVLKRCRSETLLLKAIKFFLILKHICRRANKIYRGTAAGILRNLTFRKKVASDEYSPLLKGQFRTDLEPGTNPVMNWRIGPGVNRSESTRIAWWWGAAQCARSWGGPPGAGDACCRAPPRSP